MIKVDKKFNLYWKKIDGKHFIFHKLEKPISSSVGIIKHKHFDYVCNGEFEIRDADKIQKQIGEVMMFKEDYNSLTEGDIDFIFKLILNEFDEDNNRNIFDVIKKIDFLFKSQRADLTPEKIYGIIGELAFILECEKREIQIADSYHLDDTMPFDFYVKNKDVYLEVKAALGEGRTYIVSHKQVSYDRNKTKLITVNLKRDDNGSDLLEIINKIKFTNEFLEIELGILRDKIKKDKEILKYKVNLNKTEFKVFPGPDVPYLKISPENFEDRISDIKYKIDLSGLKSEGIATLFDIINN